VAQDLHPDEARCAGEQDAVVGSQVRYG
jgi:hypothetical protein